MERIYYVNVNEKSCDVLISNKTDLKTKSIKRNKEEHYLMIMGYIATLEYNPCKHVYI